MTTVDTLSCISLGFLNIQRRCIHTHIRRSIRHTKMHNQSTHFFIFLVHPFLLNNKLYRNKHFSINTQTKISVTRQTISRTTRSPNSHKLFHKRPQLGHFQYNSTPKFLRCNHAILSLTACLASGIPIELRGR
jgi:hypothetical protein